MKGIKWHITFQQNYANDFLVVILHVIRWAYLQSNCTNKILR